MSLNKELFSTAPTHPSALSDVYRRVSFRLLPFFLLCYVLACMDRFNISFAKLQMQQAIGMSDAAYGFGAGIFILGYMLFEVPSNLLLSKIGARKTISRILVLWGMTAAAMMMVNHAHTFFSLRFLLGVFEAGFAPGMIYYLTQWYGEKHRARVMAVVLMGGPIAGMLGGPVATTIMSRLDHVHGLEGWQWLFLIEGLPTIVMGCVAFMFLTDSPSDARWLTMPEKTLLLNDVRETKGEIGHKKFGTAIKDPYIYTMALSYLCLICGLYTVNFWLPSLLKATGVTNAALGWYAAIPYTFAILAVFLVARRSDRKQERRFHSAIPAIIGALFMLLATKFHHSLFGTLVCMTVATSGIYTAYIVFWSIPTAYLKGSAAAGGLALINTIGLFGGFLSPTLIGWLKDRTGTFQSGLFAMAGILSIGGLVILFMRQPAVHAANRRS